MRIVGGRFRGRGLRAPEGQGTRPTGDRARQALFNVLEHAGWSPLTEPPRWEGRRVMDLFAGSGALGFEALSRGAEVCLFVESDGRARGAIDANAAALGLSGQTRMDRRNATDMGTRPAGAGPAYDLVFLDPPYGKGLGERALESLEEGGWVEPGALAVWERGAEEPAVEVPGWALLDQRRYGAARVFFLRLEGRA
ncbi:MAG: 16S rRNA (guanine(966)-N(2))-methyltransferase RsmD [Proteobacteria bacterium]|nr:16S rRNA (guanine(966)-N(2))-methyltransferase RsmD [Pseudomonadota bacterium]